MFFLGLHCWHVQAMAGGHGLCSPYEKWKTVPWMRRLIWTFTTFFANINVIAGRSDGGFIYDYEAGV